MSLAALKSLFFVLAFT